MARIFISKTSFDGNFHKLAHKSSSDNVLKPRDLNRPYFGKKDLKIYYPLPKGDSPYALGKKAEYIEKDLDKAADYYKKAIQDSDRAESAVKDLVGVLHQQGKTLEAMEILQKHADLFESEKDKFENIYLNLQRQLLYKGNRLNKYLKISPIPKNSKYLFITSLFSKPQRITDIRVEEDSALVKFSSHSAARKTLETFKFWDKYKIE